jgi:signal transduction histidine kinase
MSVLSSLTNRIFLASALLVLVSMGIAIYRVNVSVAAQAESDLRTGLAEAVSLVDDISRIQFADFVVKGSLIADLPVLKGATATSDPPTVLPIAREYQQKMGAALFVVVDRSDRLLAEAGRVQPAAADVAAILAACRHTADGTAFWPYPGGLLRAAAIPMEPGPAPLGTLLLGFSLDPDVAARIKAVSNSDIAFVADGRIVASTLPPAQTAGLTPVLGRTDVFTVWLAGEEFIGRVQPIDANGRTEGPSALVLISRTEHLRFLSHLRWQIALTGLAAVLMATLLGYLIARTVTRPVRALTATMREMAATGDLARTPPAIGRWDDEDARVLATTFGYMTSALNRSQREAGQRERLSSLGRLSAVVAHEIRNPLMIIKATLRNLRRHPSEDVVAATRSIDEEVGRLDRVVTDVLDFARPIRFELADADLADICRAAANAVAASADGTAIRSALPRAAPVVTDAERLRAVLINVLDNARQATRDGRPANGRAGIDLQLHRANGHVWRIEVRDHGPGVPAEDLPRLFEPFFTTRRGGSGLGLAISRNIIEGLGGTIGVESIPGTGTTVLIDLPDRAAGSGDPA